MISYLPGVEFGQLHYRQLERCKIKALKFHKGNYEGKVILSLKAKDNIKWWIDNVKLQYTQLLQPKPAVTITTDSCQTMWGAIVNSMKTGGIWDQYDKQAHINYLETKAIELGLKSLCKNVSNCHIRIRTDSSTAMTYVNKKGGLTSYKCDKVSQNIWAWAIRRKCHLTAVHVQGIFNPADPISRNQNNSSEWEINDNIFLSIIQHFNVQPTIDLFASRLNFKIERYVSFQADPGSILTNALMHDFHKEFCYAFPPINLISRFLRKVELDNLEGLIIVPCWSTQPYFSVLMKLLVDLPIMIKWRSNILFNPARTIHPIGKKLKLMCCHISGSVSKRRDFLKQLWRSSVEDGHPPRYDNTRFIIKNGCITVDNKNKIMLKQI